jgi:hypothetical protein
MRYLRKHAPANNKNILPEKLYLPVLAFAVEIVFSRAFFPEWFVFSIEYGLLFWFVLSNVRGNGTWPYLIGLGTLLNFAVISANGFRMPVWSSFFGESGKGELIDALHRGEVFGYTLVEESTHLPFLADVIGFSFYGGIVGFASLGDLFLLVGVGIILYRIMSGRGSYRRDSHRVKPRGRN